MYDGVKPLDTHAMHQCRAKWNSVAKPLHSLGLLEELLVQIAGLQGTEQLSLSGKSVLVMCADNGVVRQGVTQTDSSVTARVALSIARGTGNICKMASIAGAKVIPVDVGMLCEVDHPAILNKKLRRGTRDITLHPAMTPQEATQLIETGIQLVRCRVEQGDHLIATGEMSIGNTTTASAIASVLLQRDVDTMTGRGAGLSNAGLQRKIAAIEGAISLHRPNPDDPLDVLSKVGGFDIAAMTGVFLGGAKYGVPILIDGFISSVAALLAQRLCPDSRYAMIATHVSNEPAGAQILQALHLTPIIHGQMALGEGTGAVALMPMLDMALQVYESAGRFGDIQVAQYEEVSQ